MAGLFSLVCVEGNTGADLQSVEIKRENITLERELWEEIRGNVWKGKWRDVMDVAVKKLKPGSTSPDDNLNEAKILRQLQHQKILQLFAVSTTEAPTYVITELLVNGPLLYYLRKDQGKTVTYPAVVHMAAQIADGMAYLATMNIVHRDLRASNILVGLRHNVKVAGFELAQVMDGNVFRSTEGAMFPIKWTAPEAAKRYTFNTKSDVWSYGVLLYELSTYGKVPYPGMDPKQALEKVAAGYRMPKPTGRSCCDDALYSIMCKCWDDDPDKRPSFAFLHNRFDNHYVNIEHVCVIIVSKFGEFCLPCYVEGIGVAGGGERTRVIWDKGNGEPIRSINAVFVQAMYKFEAETEDDMPFEAEDVMAVEETPDLNWWVTTHLKTARRGYVPSNYLCHATLDGKSSYTLSVRDTEGSSGEPKIVQYDVKTEGDGKVYIHPHRTFSTILQLVDHYSASADALCTRLTVPCPQTRPVVHFRELEISRESVKLISKLGDGRFGDVWKGKLWDTVDVAVKILKPDTKSQAAFLEEGKVLCRLRHVRILQVLAVCTADTPAYIVTELMAGGTLLLYLRRDDGHLVTFPAVVRMAGQLADGLAYLERQKILHLDLRAANILVGDHQEVKVADFSDFVVLQKQDWYDISKDIKFPIKWTAPEVIEDCRINFKSLVWSFGIVLYELITRGRVPYPGMMPKEVIERVSKGYRMPRPTVGIPCTDAFYSIMCKCWNRAPKQRPSFAHLHESFENYFVSAEPHFPASVCPQAGTPSSEYSDLGTEEPVYSDIQDDNIGMDKEKVPSLEPTLPKAGVQKRPVFGGIRKLIKGVRTDLLRPKKPPLVPRLMLQFYKMDAVPRGICLIINNRDFFKDLRRSEAVLLTTRLGTDADRGFNVQSDADGEEEVQKIPDEADFLLGYSTVPGFRSYRETRTGSWYIRNLTETLNKCAE
ncbi:hypothetical protein BaRGS_00013647, partial [Batillaria attramentaria]